MQLEGRVALVTGAGIRLGRAVSEALAARGMRLALHYRQHGEEAEQLASSIRWSRGQHASPASGADGARTGPPEAGCFAGDLADPTSMAALAASVEERMGPVDALVLSAAIYPRQPFRDITPEALEEALRVNLSSPFLLASEIGRRMLERQSGHIVILLDWSLDRPYVDRLPYTLAKAGLRAAVPGLARALAPHVRVNGIAPGAVLLPEGTSPELTERIRRASLLQTIGKPGDIAEAVIYLLQSRFVTGSILTVDGGRAVA